MEFESIKIKDTNIKLIDGDRGKNYPKKTEMTSHGHTLFLNNKNISENFLDDSFGDFITEEKSNSLKKGKLNRNDIVLSTRGSVGNVGFYDSQVKSDNIRINSGMIILRNDDENFLNEYLYLLFKSPYMQNKFKEFVGGSVQNHLPIRDLQHIKIIYPPLFFQAYIVKIIRQIEEKIQINKKLIVNLEELSQTLFKRWFVDFEFPDENGAPYKANGGEMIDSELGKIPKGWIVKSLDEIANYINGLAMQKYPSNKEESLPIVKIKELKNGFTDENSNRCTTEIPEKAKIDNGDIIFSWSATLLVKMWAGGKAGLNQHLFKVTSE
ncbi:TPA: restriction endonuclease subunit S, partial [Staphylococcus aureus]